MLNVHQFWKLKTPNNSTYETIKITKNSGRRREYVFAENKRLWGSQFEQNYDERELGLADSQRECASREGL